MKLRFDSPSRKEIAESSACGVVGILLPTILITSFPSVGMVLFAVVLASVVGIYVGIRSVISVEGGEFRMSRMEGWIGVDLDNTLAEYDGWKGPDHIGDPIPLMVERVKGWLAEGKEVRIFTARVYCPKMPPISATDTQWAEWVSRDEDVRRARVAIDKFCIDTFGKVLPVTCTKDFGMLTLYDDRCVQVVPGTGELVGA